MTSKTEEVEQETAEVGRKLIRTGLQVQSRWKWSLLEFTVSLRRLVVSVLCGFTVVFVVVRNVL